MADEMIVRGTLQIRADIPAIRNATATIRLEHVPHADAAASVLATTILHVSHQPGDVTRIPFAIAIPAEGPTRHLNLFAHVDVDGDGELGIGDLVTTQAYPVGSEQTIHVQVELVA